MDLGALETCVYCPNLCRHVCPVAVGTGRESATPTAMVTIAWLGMGDAAGPACGPAEALAAADLCVGCGACTAACILERPVADLLAAVRAVGPAPALADPPPVEAAAPGPEPGLVAVECGAEPWSEALATRLGQPVGRWRTADHLGERGVGHPAFGAHAQRLRDRVGGRRLVVSCLGCLRAARAAALDAVHLAELLAWQPTGVAHHPCDGPTPAAAGAADALACCGACAPLSHSHPELAEELGRAAAEAFGTAPGGSPDARCAAWLRRFGARVDDPLTQLLHPDLHP